MKQVKFQLKNKLKVILIPSYKSPVVSVQMWVKTGSADEKKGEEGISHFIEHLVFKGTKKYKVGEIASAVEASGGELNAYTSFDQTVFYVTISKAFQETALDVISQMMGYPTFDPQEVNSEREVVCEEIKMGLDSPSRQASQLLFGTMFKKHSYGKPVIGYEKNVRQWPVKKIKNFFQSRYVPENMCLIVSGDFEPLEMKQHVGHYFGGFENFKLKKIVRAKEPIAKTVSFAAKTKDLKDTTYNLAFRAPNIKHKDVPAIDVLMMILGQGETSRLFSKLRLESNKVSTVSGYSYNPQDDGLISINFKVADQNPLEAFKGIFEEIHKIKNLLVSNQELAKAVVNISSEQFYSVETVDGIANKVGSSQFYLNDSLAHDKYLKQIQKVKAADVIRVAKKYLQLKAASYTTLGPASEKKALDTMRTAHKMWLGIEKIRIVSDKKRKEKKTLIPKIVFKELKKASKEKFEVEQLDSGAKIIFYPSREIPTVSAKLLMGGGARIENIERLGETELLLRTWMSGTKTKSENEILKTIEESASGLSPFGGKNTVGLSLDYMSVFENKMLQLAEEIMVEPALNKEIIEREKLAMLRQIKSREDQPSYLCGKQFVQQMFPSHPVAYDSLGSAESLQKINEESLKAYLNKVQHMKNMLVVVAGDYSKSSWIKFVESLGKNFSKGERQQKKQQYKELSENKRIYLEKDKEQSHVIVGWQSLNITDKDRFVLQVIQAIMAGQGGRLFIELRDKNSLAYSVSPIRMESLECGYFGGYIACSPDKVEKALKMFHEEFQKLCQKKVPQEELLRAQRYLIGQHDIGLQRKSSICNTIAFDDFYGNNFVQSLHVQDDYLKVTADDVQRLAQKIFSKNYIESIVGQKI